MKLNTGKIAFPIEFDNGEKDCIYFNPNDPDLSIRLNDFQERMESISKEYEGITLNNEGNADDTSEVIKFKKFQEKLFDEINIAFGGEISSVIFKYCSPFAIVNGDFFINQFIESIKPEIEKNIKKAKNDIQKKFDKYVGKYKK